MKSKGTNVEIPISNSQKRAKLTMNSPLSIRDRRMLLQNVSPNVPVFRLFSENGKLVDVMEIIGKEYDQLTVQYTFDEACMQAITWAILDRPCDPWAKRIIFLVTLRTSLSTGVASPLLCKLVLPKVHKAWIPIRPIVTCI